MVTDVLRWLMSNGVPSVMASNTGFMGEQSPSSSAAQLARCVYGLVASLTTVASSVAASLDAPDPAPGSWEMVNDVQAFSSSVWVWLLAYCGFGWN